MRGQHRFHLDRRDAVAHGVHEVVVAAVEPEIAVGIEAREVAAREPVAAHHRRLLLRALPVAEHQPRLGAVDGEQPGLARRQRLGRALDGQDGDAAPRLGPAGGARTHRYRRAARHVSGDLAHAERLVERQASARGPLGQQVGAQRLARGDAVAQTRQVVSREVGVFEDLAVHARHGSEDRGAVGFDQAGPDAAVARAVVEHRGGAAGPGVGDADAERVGPVHGAGMKHHVGLGQPEPVGVHRAPAQMARWAWSTPFGRLVVPEV